MPCTFEPDDSLLFSVESDKMKTRKAANQHACFRAVAHMLVADQRQVRLAADRRHVRLVDCHWRISVNELKVLITNVLHQFPVAASSSFDQFPAATDRPICGVIECNFPASKPHPAVAKCFICDRHLLQMAQHNSPATEPQPSVAAAASSDILLPKPLAVEPPSEQCLSMNQDCFLPTGCQKRQLRQIQQEVLQQHPTKRHCQLLHGKRCAVTTGNCASTDR